MSSKVCPITPETKVGEMLECYPALEEVLIGISPTYRALKSPVLRKTVAKVATLRQVAKVGNVSLSALIVQLRAAAGQAGETPAPEEESPASPRPCWLIPGAPLREFDAREIIESGGHPMPQVMADLSSLKPGEIYVLMTPFLPAPLIDLAAQKGYEAWSENPSPQVFRTYFLASRK